MVIQGDGHAPRCQCHTVKLLRAQTLRSLGNALSPCLAWFPLFLLPLIPNAPLLVSSTDHQTLVLCSASIQLFTQHITSVKNRSMSWHHGLIQAASAHLSGHANCETTTGLLWVTQKIQHAVRSHEHS